MKKKGASILLILLTLLCLTPAWGGGLKVGFVMGVGGLGDQSFNDITYAGLMRAKQKHGIQLIMEEPADTEDGAKKAFENMIAQDVDLIVANGWNFIDLVTTFANQYPGRRFLINDAVVEGLPNVISVSYGQHEGSYLVGALAGWMTRTRCVGFIGGNDDPVIQAFKVGYESGVLHALAGARILVNFVTFGDDYSGYEKPEEGFRLAEAQFARGADIIFAVAGLTGNGIISAAQKNGKFVIGVDSDQDHMAKGHVLTSMMKRLDNTTFQEITQMVRGRFDAGAHYYGLKQGGVSLTPMTYTRQLIPEKVLQDLETVKQKIIAGEIVVPNALDQQGE